MRGVGGVGFAAKFAPVGFGHVDAVVFCGCLDIGEGLFALVVGDVFDLVKAGDGVADVRGIVERLFALVGEGEDGCGEFVALVCVKRFAVFVMFPGSFHDRLQSFRIAPNYKRLTYRMSSLGLGVVILG